MECMIIVLHRKTLACVSLSMTWCMISYVNKDPFNWNCAHYARNKNVISWLYVVFQMDEPTSSIWLYVKGRKMKTFHVDFEHRRLKPHVFVANLFRKNGNGWAINIMACQKQWMVSDIVIFANHTNHGTYWSCNTVVGIIQIVYRYISVIKMIHIIRKIWQLKPCVRKITEHCDINLMYLLRNKTLELELDITGNRFAIGGADVTRIQHVIIKFAGMPWMQLWVSLCQ